MYEKISTQARICALRSTGLVTALARAACNGFPFADGVA